jgi:hypothetical protein
VVGGGAHWNMPIIFVKIFEIDHGIYEFGKYFEID